MNCDQVNGKIALFVLGDLPKSEQLTVAEHLMSCPACRVARDEYSFLVAQIKGSTRSDSLTPDFSFAREVRSAVRAETNLASYRSLARRAIAIAGSVAACLLLFLTGWQMWVSSGNRLASVLEQRHPRRSPARASAAPAVLQAWQHDSAPSAPGSAADGVVVCGQSMYLLQKHGPDSFVAALDIRTGEQKWLSDVRSCGYLLADDARVYCLAQGESGTVDLVALDAADGTLLWEHRQKRDDPLHNPCRPSLLPQGRICWTADKAVHMLDRANGDQIWSHSIPDGGLLSAAVVVAGDLYVANVLGLHCLDAVTGDEQWRLACGDVMSGGGRPMLAADDGEIYASMSLSLRRSRLFCMNVAERRILWSRVVDCAARLDAVGDVLCLRDQNVQAFDGATGRLLWTCPASGCGIVTYSGGLAYFVDSSNQGRLVALDRYTGAKVWELAGVKSCDAFIKVEDSGFLKTPDGVVHALVFKG